MRLLIPLLMLGACGNAVVVLPGDVPVDTGMSGEEEGDTELPPAPDIRVSAKTVRAEDIYVGCSEEESFSISNVGDATLTISDIHQSSGRWSIDEDLELPIELDPEESVDVELRFVPAAAGDADGTLTIESDDEDEAKVQVALVGSGIEPDHRYELFVQTSAVGADVIFALDAGDDMVATTAEFLEAVVPMLTLFDAAGADARVSVVVDDDACVNGLVPFVDTDWSAGDAGVALASMAEPDGGEHLLAHQALEMLRLATSQTEEQDCNEGLLEAERQVHLVGISRSADASPDAVETYLDAYDAVSDVAVVHGIGGPLPSGCDDAAAYTGVYEASVTTGGTFHSVCEDLDSALAELASEVVTWTLRRSFTIDGTPQVDTLVVKVDGETRSAGWRWESSVSSIVFDPAEVPPNGATIEVTWVEEPDCDA